MALTATFAADFNAFTKSLTEAQVKLGVFDRETKNAARSMRRELESISGQKVAAEAARMAEAVKRLGGEGGTAAGLLKLTDEELKRVSQTMDAAAAKAGRLGEALPDSLKKVRDEIAKLSKPVEDASAKIGFLDSTFAKLTASFTAANLIDKAITSVVSFGQAAFESAGQVIDLSNKTGLSTKTIQQMQAVASQTGSSLEAFTSAAYKLGINIATGTKDAREAVDALGLSFQNLQSSTPDEQFAQTVRALEQVESTTERNRLGQALFGKQWAEVAASVAEGYSNIANAASISSDAQLQALDAAGDAWDKFKDDATATIRSFLGEVVLMSKGLKEASLAPSLEDAKIFALMAASGAPLPMILATIADKHAEMAKAQANARQDIELTVPVVEDYVAKLAAVRNELNQLKPATKAQLDAAIKFGATYEEVAKNITISETAFNHYKAELASGAIALKNADSATAAWNDSIARNKVELEKAAKEVQLFIDRTNLALSKGTNPADFTAKLESLTKPITTAILTNATLQAKYQSDLTTLVQERTLGRVEFQLKQIERWAHNEKAVLDRTAGAWQENARLIDQIASERAAAVVLSTDEVQEAIGALGVMLPGMAPMFASFFGAAEDGAEKASKSTKDWDDNLGDLARSLSQMAEVSGGAFGGVVQELAGVVTSMDVAHKGAVLMDDGWKKLSGSSKDVAKGLTEISIGALSTASSLVQAVQQGDKLNATLSGAATGAQIGALFGGVGAGVGAAAGAIAGYLSAKSKEHEQVKRAIADVEEALARLGSVQDEINAGAQTWEITVVAVRDLYLSLGRSAEEAEEVVRRMWDTRNPQGVADAISEITQALNEQEKNWKIAAQAMEEFGITADEMGQAFEQHQMDEAAGDLLEKINALVAVGTPMEVIYNKVGGSVADFLARALETGTRVPLEFQGIVAKMLELGPIVDESGNKFEHLGQVPWADNINADLQDLTRAIQGLTGVIGNIGSMFGRAARDAEVSTNKMIEGVNNVEEAVDALNFGHSPGGLKEIPLLLEASQTAMAAFASESMRQLDTVYGGLDDLLKTMGEFEEELRFQKFGALSPETEAEIARIEEQITRLRDSGADDGPLRRMKRDLEDFNTATKTQIDILEEARDRATTKADKAQAEKRLEDFKRQTDAQRKIMEASITAEERRLEDLRMTIDKQIDLLEKRIEELKKTKNPLEGFPIPPTMLNAEQAIARVNEVFQRYSGGNASPGQLAAIGHALRRYITPQGTISQDLLNEFLRRLVETQLNAQFAPGVFQQILAQQNAPALAGGTMGQYGEWFKDWKGGTPVTLHREEAVINRSQAVPFAEDVLGRRSLGAPDVVNELRNLRSSLREMLAEERYKAALANRDASVGAV